MTKGNNILIEYFTCRTSFYIFLPYKDTLFRFYCKPDVKWRPGMHIFMIQRIAFYDRYICSSFISSSRQPLAVEIIVDGRNVFLSVSFKYNPCSCWNVVCFNILNIFCRRRVRRCDIIIHYPALTNILGCYNAQNTRRNRRYIVYCQRVCKFSQSSIFFCTLSRILALVQMHYPF